MLHTTSTDRVIVWILLVIGIAAAVAGSVFGLYESLGWYDEVVHGFMFFALTLFVSLLLYSVTLTGKRSHAVLLVLTITVFGLGLGGLWEILEWAWDQLFTQKNTIQGKQDTIIDLIIDTGGALLGGIVAVIMAEEPSRKAAAYASADATRPHTR